MGQGIALLGEVHRSCAPLVTYTYIRDVGNTCISTPYEIGTQKRATSPRPEGASDSAFWVVHVVSPASQTYLSEAETEKQTPYMPAKNSYHGCE